jgi:thiamine pyrophosphokinase
MAADGGAGHVKTLGWPIDLFVGDLDSASVSLVDSLAKGPGFKSLIYPKDKDQTDFELLFSLAVDYLLSPGEITVCCGLGRRWDMTAANLILPFAGPWRKRWLGSRIVFLAGLTEIFCLQGPAELTLPGDISFSLIPVRKRAGPVSLTGEVSYPLDKGFLSWGLTLGLSNETGSGGGRLFLEQGFLLVTCAPKNALE